MSEHKIGDLVYGSGIGLGTITTIYNGVGKDATSLYGIEWIVSELGIVGYTGMGKMYSNAEITQMKYFLKVMVDDGDEGTQDR